MSKRKAKEYSAKSLKNTDLRQKPGGGYPGNWTGRFIWDNGKAVPYQYKLRFRKSFTMPDVPTDAILRITAADRYILYINGQYIGRGPSRGSGPEWKSYDIYNVAEYLQKGDNVIAVLAHYFGTSNTFSYNQRSGGWAEFEWRKENGETQIIGTDKTWKTSPAPAYSQDVNVFNAHVGIPNEIFDARIDEPLWNTLEFDDEKWENAMEIDTLGGGPFYSPWHYLEARKTPRLREREVKPVRVEKIGEVRELPSAVFAQNQIAERLALEPISSLHDAKAENVKELIKGNSEAIFQSSLRARTLGSIHPFIILDFGRPCMAIPRLEIEADAGAVLEMTFGNSLQPDGRVDALQLMAMSGCARNGDRYITRSGRQIWQLYEARFGRYLQIVIRNQSENYPRPTGAVQSGIPGPLAPLKLISATVIVQEYPVKQTGSFSCSDNRLNRIWQAGVNTSYLNMQNDLQFDPERERATYTLCGEVEQIHLAMRAGFSAPEFTEENFRQTFRTQLPGGHIQWMLRGALPWWLSELPQLSANKHHRLPIEPSSTVSISNITWYPQAILNYFHHNGKKSLIEEYYQGLLCYVAFYSDFEDNETGLLSNLPGVIWLDWSNRDLRGFSFSINAIYYKTLLDMKEISDIVGDSSKIKLWAKKAERIRTSLQKLHWVPEKKLFCDSVVNGQQSEIFTELANGLALLYDIPTAKQRQSIVNLLQNPEKNLERTCWVSPLYFHYVIEGLIKAGAADYAYKHLAERMSMVVFGDAFPTLGECWPDNPPGWNVGEMSTVHGGAGGGTWTLSTHALGIYPLEPGYKRIRINPQHGALTWAEGVLPTPLGNISVKWAKKENSYEIEAELPEGMTGEIVIPGEIQKDMILKYNGKAISTLANHLYKSEKGHTVFFIETGKHCIKNVIDK